MTVNRGTVLYVAPHRSNTMYAWEKVNIRTGMGAAPEAVTYSTKVGDVSYACLARGLFGRGFDHNAARSLTLL